MPVKCSFCHKRDDRASAYETHLRSAHANLDILLASTIRNPFAPADVLNHWRTYVSDPNEHFEHSNSECQSDPGGDTPGTNSDAPDDTLTRKPETEVLMDNTNPVAEEQEDYLATGKPLERLQSILKNTGICARTHRYCLPMHKVSNLHLGSLRAKSQTHGSTITFRMVSETRHQSAIALGICWRIYSDPWILIARICQGLKDMLKTVRDYYPSYIGMSETA